MFLWNPRVGYIILIGIEIQPANMRVCLTQAANPAVIVRNHRLAARVEA